MGRIPKGWKKESSSSDCEIFSRKGYQIYIWKLKKPKRYVVEAFRNLSNYKRRLFSKEFRDIKKARKFAWELMKQKEIRAYYTGGKIEDLM